MPKLSESH